MEKSENKSPITFINPYNANQRPKSMIHEKIPGKSKTVPGLVMSASEMMEKFLSGQTVGHVYEAHYAENPQFDDWLPQEEMDFDLADLAEWKEKYQTRIDKAKTKLSELETKKTKIRAQEHEAFKKWQKNKKESTPPASADQKTEK